MSAGRANMRVMTNPLLTPLALGDIALPNRILMAPLTRARSNREGLANPLMAQYYAERASAGLIISEATAISLEARGWPNAPGIWNAEQTASWQQVTQAVHARGGRIVLQLWHMGRISHSSLHGIQPVSASATTAPGEAHTYTGKQPYEQARALDTAEIPRLIADYTAAAENAKLAGFDGVQLHGANGYLIDQFLRDATNLRTDQYGGSIDNRTRFLREVTSAVVESWDSGHVGIRLSPVSPANDIKDSAPQALFTRVVEQLNDFGLAYLHVVEGATIGPREVPDGFDLQILRHAFKGPYMANNGYDAALARETLAAGRADAIAFGRLFISNPDLVTRLREGAALARWDKNTFYGGGAEGYTDYPTLEQEARAA